MSAYTYPNISAKPRMSNDDRFELAEFKSAFALVLTRSIREAIESVKGSPFTVEVINLSGVHSSSGSSLDLCYEVKLNPEFKQPPPEDDPIDRAWKAAEAKEKEERAKAFYGVADGGAAMTLPPGGVSAPIARQDTLDVKLDGPLPPGADDIWRIQEILFDTLEHDLKFYDCDARSGRYGGGLLDSGSWDKPVFR